MGGAWLMLLGWFGLGAARNQSQLLRLQHLLQAIPVREVAQRRYRVLEAGLSLRQLSQLLLQDGDSPRSPARAGASGLAGADLIPRAGGLSDWWLVCDRGRWQGVIDSVPLQQLPVQRWDGETVGDHLRPLASLPTIAQEAPLWQAVLQLEEHPRLLVLSPAGLPCGTVEKPELGEAVLRRLGLNPPAPLLEAARRHNTYPLGLALAPVARAMVSSGEVQPAPAD